MAKKPPKPKKASLDQRVRTDAKLRARVLKNPGLRSKLSDATLQRYAPAQAKSRALGKRLATPIAPGSSITERDLAHEAQAAQAVKYGPVESDLTQQIGRQQGIERDTGTFFDQYRQLQADHAARVAAFQQGAQTALAQTAAGITGLSGAEGAALQQASNAAAVPGVAPAGDLSQLANQAAAARQTLMGTFQGEQAMTGAAANTYASGQVPIAGAQKLSALAGARARTGELRQKQSDLRREEGAFNQQFRTERRADEFKNQLALGALNLNQAKADADAASKTPEAVAATTTARQSASSEATNAQKYGYSVHQWRMLGPKGRANVIAKSKKTATSPGSNVITSGPLAGKTKTWVESHPDEAGKLVSDYERRHGPKGKNGTTGKGPEWQTPAAQSAGASDAANLKDLARRAREGTKFAPGPRDKPGTGTRLNRRQAAQKIQQAANVRDPALLSAALDAVYVGHLSPETVRKLIAAGYKPSRIMSALGVTGRSGSSGSRPTRPGSGPNRARQ